MEALLIFRGNARKDLGLALFNYTSLSGREPQETRGEAIVSGPAAARWKLNINLNILKPTGRGGVGVNARIACRSESGPDTCQSPGRLMATGRCPFKCSLVTSERRRCRRLQEQEMDGTLQRSCSQPLLLPLGPQSSVSAARRCTSLPYVTESAWNSKPLG